MSGARPGRGASAVPADPRRVPVLLVRPTASGGLAAHVDQERDLLRADGRAVEDAAVDIRPRPHPTADPRTVRRLRRAVRELSARTGTAVAVHAHGLRAGALAALALRAPGLRPTPRPRLVVTLHNRPIGSRGTRTVGAGLLRLLARGADEVLAVSPDLAADARRAGARAVRHAVIPAPERAPAAAPPTAAAVDAAPSGTAGRPLEVLVIARLAPQKGLHDLFDAAALLAADPGPDGPVRIRVAGDGPLRDELAARAAAEQLPVELLGRREDVPALLRACDLVVSAARWEGQPVSLQEALRAGRAIVATDAGGTRWVTEDAAQLLPVGDPRALAAAITAMRDPQRRRAAEDASRRRAARLPGPADLLDQLAEVLTPPADRW